MDYRIVALTPSQLDQILEVFPPESLCGMDRRAYFSEGSVARCLLADGVPVFAGGISNLQWQRGEAWLLPTPFFRKHLKVCLRAMRLHLPAVATQFQRVQATCAKGVSERLFEHLGFEYEGTMRKFGPQGQTCSMYARIFE